MQTPNVFLVDPPIVRCSDSHEEPEVDEVAMLLQRVRSHLEDAQLMGSTWSTGSTLRGSENKGRRHDHEHWSRLRYLEWCVFFLKKQRCLHDAMQNAAVALEEASADEKCAARCDETLMKINSEESVQMSGKSGILFRTPSSQRASSEGGELQMDVTPQCGPLLPFESGSGASVVERERPSSEEKHTAGVSCSTPWSNEATSGKNADEVNDNHSLQKVGPVTDTEWKYFRTWNPSKISLLINVQQPMGDEMYPVRHVLCLSTLLHEKPQGMQAKDVLLRAQGRYCKSCLCSLRKRHFPIPSWGAARFCYYTGMYYCTSCHSGRKNAIPARILHFWDFRRLPVCNDAFDFLELQRERPLYCLSASNPFLYGRVFPLHMARCLRLQVMALREVGVQCQIFRQIFYCEDATTQCDTACCLNVVSPLHPDDGEDEPRMKFHVVRDRRYLMEDSEIWSFADLQDLHRFHPKKVDESSPLSSTYTAHLAGYSRSDSIAPMESEVIIFLKRLRTCMVHHILKKGCPVCLRNSIDICRWCCPPKLLNMFEREHLTRNWRQEHHEVSLKFSSSPPFSCSQEALRTVEVDAPVTKHLFTVYTFDLLHARPCPRCGACYHKRCFYRLQREMAGCMGCLRCRNTDRGEGPPKVYHSPTYRECSSNSSSLDVSDL